MQKNQYVSLFDSPRWKLLALVGDIPLAEEVRRLIESLGYDSSLIKLVANMEPSSYLKDEYVLDLIGSGDAKIYYKKIWYGLILDDDNIVFVRNGEHCLCLDYISSFGSLAVVIGNTTEKDPTKSAHLILSGISELVLESTNYSIH
jgi:hypothetical protein